MSDHEIEYRREAGASPAVWPRLPEIDAWAASEGAELVAVGLARGRITDTLAVRLSAARTRDGAEVRTIAPSRAAPIGCGLTTIVLLACIFLAGPALSVPLALVIAIAVIAAAVLGAMLRSSLSELRAGPLLELSADGVHLPRLALRFGKPEALGGVVLRVRCTERRDNGSSTTRYSLAAVLHETGGVRRLIVLPAKMTAGGAGRLLARLLEGRGSLPMRMVELNVEGRRGGVSPAVGD